MAFEDPYQTSTEFGEDYRDVGSSAVASQFKPGGLQSHHSFLGTFLVPQDMHMKNVCSVLLHLPCPVFHI